MHEDDLQRNTERTVILQDEGLRKLKGFVQIPKFILMHKKLSFGAKVAYGVLLGYAWQDGFCFPAQSSMANDLGCSIRQAQRLLEELKKSQLVSWTVRGLNRPNIYTMLPLPTDPYYDSAKNKDTTDMSYPDTTNITGQDTTNMSYNIYPNGNTHKTVNGLGNLLKKLPPIEQPEEETEYIAQSILETLGVNDLHSRKFHYLVASRIPERTIRKHLAEIRAEGARNPPALFTHRIRKAIEEQVAKSHKDTLAAMSKRVSEGKHVR